tara:strand:- start:3477 stop:3683 length:207 start_codon:yes stop_codon:yes gene_type:complete
MNQKEAMKVALCSVNAALECFSVLHEHRKVEGYYKSAAYANETDITNALYDIADLLRDRIQGKGETDG